ncbi:1,4-dihydroxy-2-naphthoyl-CoA synthase [Streptomyces alboniger]
MSPFTGSATRTPDWHHLRLTVDDGVATVTLARPDRLNALTFGAYADLRDLLAELSRDRSVRALVLGGEGRGFCSGGDVDEIIGATLAMDTAQLLDFNRMTGQVVRAIRECPFPVIAAVHGVAAGAGAVFALAADLRVADPSAKFSFLFARRRTPPAATWAPPACCPASSASATPPASSCWASRCAPPRPQRIGLITARRTIAGPLPADQPPHGRVRRRAREEAPLPP